MPFYNYRHLVRKKNKKILSNSNISYERIKNSLLIERRDKNAKKESC